MGDLNSAWVMARLVWPTHTEPTSYELMVGGAHIHTPPYWYFADNSSLKISPHAGICPICETGEERRGEQVQVQRQRQQWSSRDETV